jgi:hypothetical protein
MLELPPPLLVGLEYITVLNITKHAPIENNKFGRKSKSTAEIAHDRSMLNELANTFRTLSAYFTTTATINPPTAWTVITERTNGEYPTKKP